MFIGALYPYLKPNSYTYPSVLEACGGLVRVGCGKMIHTHLIKNWFCNWLYCVASAQVSIYMQNAEYAVCYTDVWYIDEIPDRDVVCWNTEICWALLLWTRMEMWLFYRLEID